MMLVVLTVVSIKQSCICSSHCGTLWLVSLPLYVQLLCAPSLFAWLIHKTCAKQHVCFLDACSLFELLLLMRANNTRRPVLGRMLGLLCRPGLCYNSLPLRLLKGARKERLHYLCVREAQENKATWPHHSLSIFKIEQSKVFTGGRLEYQAY